ncbi:MAG: DNA-protecting protein DprA [Anaerolineae bacterium]|nr:DNA-protecting protein DprA [Anaerolineae bacterium]
MSRGDLPFWIGFNKVRGIGPVRLRALRTYFGELSAAWRATPADLHAAGLDRRSLENLVNTRQKLDLGAELVKLERAGVHVITSDDADYPRRLARVPDAPPVLYVKGELTAQDDLALGVVGTRRATPYGRQATREIVTELARHGVTIVSGLARGIDGEAHQAALDAGGRTIAVLACGLDIIYPPEHTHLAERITQHGALVSEYGLGTEPEAANFPPRNRIISGLTRGVLITEAGLGSGALITADYAREQGRELFAVPGNIFQRGCDGTNRLLQEGAKVVLSAADLLDELQIAEALETQEEAVQHVAAIIPGDPFEARLLEQLSAEPRHVDEVSRAVGLPIAAVSSALSIMELKGLVREVGGMNYVAAFERHAA